MNKRFALALVAAIVAGGVLYALFAPPPPQTPAPDASQPQTRAAAAAPPPALDDRPATYAEAVERARLRRGALAARYDAATSGDQRQRILSEASAALTRSLYEDLMPFWYGTAWGFNGVTETPGRGKIACGYLVSTVLRDAGLRVERRRLARQASEKIILSLTGEAHVRRFSNVPLGQFVRTLSNWGPGVYVVGLDYHAGFLVVDADRKVRFIHSPGVGPKHVINESAAESPVLGASRYRVAGRITADAQLLLTWLRQDPIATRTR